MTATTTDASATDLHERIVNLIRALLCELELAQEAGDVRRLALLRDGLAALVDSTKGNGA